MKLFVTTAVFMALGAIPAMADSKAFRNIIGDAANIQMDAESLRDVLKSGKFTDDSVKSDVASLAKHIDALQADVDALDGRLQDLTEAQKKDWELAKTKVSLLGIFADWKTAALEAGDVNKNRKFLQTHANGIAVRAEMLMRTVNRLDR